jgi:hypothetical protein
LAEPPETPAGAAPDDAISPGVLKTDRSLSFPRKTAPSRPASSPGESVACPTGTLTVAIVALVTKGNSTRATVGSLASDCGTAAGMDAGEAVPVDGLLAVRTTGTGGFSCGIRARSAASTRAVFISAKSTVCCIGQSASPAATTVAANGSTIGMSVG